jgi:5-methylcytosine-specific restriction enzyme B
MNVPVKEVMFRKIQTSNANALLGNNRGEYDLRIGRSDEVVDFLRDLPEEAPTDLGGWTKRLAIQPFEGINPVPEEELSVSYIGDQSQRKDLRFPRLTTRPYPLWAPSRTYPHGANVADLEGDVVLVIKDSDDCFHARWVRKSEIARLPTGLAAHIANESVGVYTVPTVTTSGPSPRAREVIDALHSHKNVLLYGPPGTGKTHLVSEVRRHFAGSAVTLDTTVEHDALAENKATVRTAWATFHQSYSYEDFVVGLRPQPNSEGPGFELVAHPGILLELAEWARLDPSNGSLLVVDEINRGNVSRIFGEFITLMEPDKRLGSDGAETATTLGVRLPFIDKNATVTVDLGDDLEPSLSVPFTMPLNVFTLATMNSVDKSVAPLDAALRRRFHVIDLSPRLEEFGAGQFPEDPLALSPAPVTLADVKDVQWLAVRLIMEMNASITRFLGPEFQFGEWYLGPLIGEADADEAKGVLAGIWRSSILPQLEDYFVGRADQLAAVLSVSEVKSSSTAFIIDEPTDAESRLGASRSIRANPRADDATVLTYLLDLVRLRDSARDGAGEDILPSSDG